MLLAALIDAVLLAALWWWAQRLARSRPARRRLIRIVGVTSATLAVVALLGAITTLTKTFGAATNADPARRQELLGEGIQFSMRCLVASVIAIVLGAIALAVIQVRTRTFPSTPPPPNRP